ncbi:MAG: transcriptional regulator, partial [Sediminibacterium sp.]
GFAMSLRALQPSIGGKLNGLWKLFGMRSIDTLMKKTIPHPWYNWKRKRIFDNAQKALQKS